MVMSVCECVCPDGGIPTCNPVNVGLQHPMTPIMKEPRLI